MLNISCNLLNVVLKVETRVSIWVQVVSIWVVYPCDHVADWGSPLATKLPQIRRIYCCVLIAREKIKIRSQFSSTECLLLLHHGKVEKLLS